MIKEIEAKSILRKHKRIDSWFISRYGMNLYRGCSHNCSYCDGRSEKYRVEGEFAQDIGVKVNAIDVLRREIDPRRRRVPLKKCFMMIGGGVGDSYQPLEKKYRLTRQALELMLEFKWPVHILTKSTEIERDLDLIKAINRQSRAVVNFSFSSADDHISARFEPGVPPPSQRLETLARFKKEGISCGLFLMPVIPFITDTPEQIGRILLRAKDIGVDYIIFSPMTLKEGRQKDYFFETLEKFRSGLTAKYENVYPPHPYGLPTDRYMASAHSVFLPLARKHKLPIRMPNTLFNDILDENDLVEVLLGQLDYLYKIKGKSSPFAYAASSVSRVKEPLSSMRNRLRELRGVGATTERIILEILNKGKSSYLESLLGG